MVERYSDKAIEVEQYRGWNNMRTCNSSTIGEGAIEE